MKRVWDGYPSDSGREGLPDRLRPPRLLQHPPVLQPLPGAPDRRHRPRHEVVRRPAAGEAGGPARREPRAGGGGGREAVGARRAAGPGRRLPGAVLRGRRPVRGRRGLGLPGRALLLLRGLQHHRLRGPGQRAAGALRRPGPLPRGQLRPPALRRLLPVFAVQRRVHPRPAGGELGPGPGGRRGLPARPGTRRAAPQERRGAGPRAQRGRRRRGDGRRLGRAAPLGRDGLHEGLAGGQQGLPGRPPETAVRSGQRPPAPGEHAGCGRRVLRGRGRLRHHERQAGGDQRGQVGAGAQGAFGSRSFPPGARRERALPLQQAAPCQGCGSVKPRGRSSPAPFFKCNSLFKHEPHRPSVPALLTRPAPEFGPKRGTAYLGLDFLLLCLFRSWKYRSSRRELSPGTPRLNSQPLRGPSAKWGQELVWKATGLAFSPSCLRADGSGAAARETTCPSLHLLLFLFLRSFICKILRLD